MMSDSQKRKATLGILDKLRSKGMPERPREDEMNSMFMAMEEEPEEKDKEKKKKKKKLGEDLPDIEGEIPDYAVTPTPQLSSR